MLRSPKAKFIASPHRQAFEAIATSPAFEEASLAALLQLQLETPVEPEKATWAAMQLVGAKRFLDILTTIHQAAKEPPEVKRPGLDYKAGV